MEAVQDIVLAELVVTQAQEAIDRDEKRNAFRLYARAETSVEPRGEE
jgi:hypothetical protein